VGYFAHLSRVDTSHKVKRMLQKKKIHPATKEREEDEEKEENDEEKEENMGL
jgi:hypothetical protein